VNQGNQVNQVNHSVSRDLGFLGVNQVNQVNHSVSRDLGFFGGEPGES